MVAEPHVAWRLGSGPGGIWSIGLIDSVDPFGIHYWIRTTPSWPEGWRYLGFALE